MSHLTQRNDVAGHTFGIFDNAVAETTMLLVLLMTMLATAAARDSLSSGPWRTAPLSPVRLSTTALPSKQWEQLLRQSQATDPGLAATHDDDFLQRLRQEEQALGLASSSPTSTGTLSSWTKFWPAAVGGIVAASAVGALWILNPSTLASSSSNALSESLNGLTESVGAAWPGNRVLWDAARSMVQVAWLPWIWIRTSGVASSSSSLLATILNSDTLFYGHLLWKLDLWSHVTSQVWQLGTSTLKQMLVLEGGRRVWNFAQDRLFTRQERAAQPSLVVDRDRSHRSQDTPHLPSHDASELMSTSLGNEVGFPSEQRQPLGWKIAVAAMGTALQEFVTAAIHNGTRKRIQSIFQRHFSQAVDALYDCAVAPLAAAATQIAA
jgi:hypothetical protein